MTGHQDSTLRCSRPPQCHHAPNQTPQNGNRLRITLSRALLQITTVDQARQWGTQLQQFETTHNSWLKEKTHVDDLVDKRFKRKLVRRGGTPTTGKDERGNYWSPPPETTTCLPTSPTLTDHNLAATTNCLEGGINAHLKNLARTHRGQPPEHQRIIIDWWLAQHTSAPPNPMKLGRKQKWGKAQLAKAIHHYETAQDKPTADGRPALYDRGIESTPTNSMGNQKGWLGH
ncbi:MAG: hypothetical protein MR654_10465 [Corynebacterium glucuronolyticum]|nr:hypothetical protein [Corynebacterium glucuronolyticum]